MSRATAEITVTTRTGYVLHAVAICEDGYDLHVGLRCPPHRLALSESSHVMHMARQSVPRRAVNGQFTPEGLEAARNLVLRMWGG